MVTKRMMLRAGGLALLLIVNACSEDRAGGTTGLSETAIPAERAVPPSVPPAPAVASGGGDVQSPATPSGSEGVNFETGGHRYSILVASGPDGGDVTRVIQDGALLLEAAGTPASLAAATDADVRLFYEGQSVFSDVVSLQGTPLAEIPAQFLAPPPPPGGPMRQMALPCAAQLSAFGAASSWLSLDLYLARVAPGSVSRREMRRAIAAVVAAAVALYYCLATNW